MWTPWITISCQIWIWWLQYCLFLSEFEDERPVQGSWLADRWNEATGTQTDSWVKNKVMEIPGWLGWQNEARDLPKVNLVTSIRPRFWTAYEMSNMILSNRRRRQKKWQSSYLGRNESHCQVYWNLLWVSWFSLEQNCSWVEDKLSSSTVDFIRSEG